MGLIGAFFVMPFGRNSHKASEFRQRGNGNADVHISPIAEATLFYVVF